MGNALTSRIKKTSPSKKLIMETTVEGEVTFPAASSLEAELVIRTDPSVQGTLLVEATPSMQAKPSIISKAGPSTEEKTSTKSANNKSSRSGKKTPVKHKFDFPVGEIHRMISKERNLKDVDPHVPIFLAEAEKCVTENILKNAVDRAIYDGRTSLEVEDVTGSIRDDPELNDLVGDSLRDFE